MDQSRTVTPKQFHDSLMRPAVFQILRAQGYSAARPGVIDAITELAGDYMFRLAEKVARNAEHNNPVDCQPTVRDMRMALEDVGAMSAPNWFMAQDCEGGEDLRGVESFTRWFSSEKNAKIARVAEAFQQTGDLLPAPDEERVKEIDFLTQLMMKHHKSDQESKYSGTVLGKGIDHGEIAIEGGELPSLELWHKVMVERQQRLPDPESDSRPPSSGLSSLDEGDVEMMDM
ncbi:Bromodomain associated domain protein [Xylariales sp. PMI_506]|nr:Bromodomain associated domain protein [Xylariales sp. PMI_506]